MLKSLFSGGYRGLSDSIFSGVKGSVYRSVGIDHRSEPGKISVQQKLTKDSSTVIDELCKVSLPVSDGSKLWFSSESGKIWREVSGTYTLIHTLNPVGTFNQTKIWEEYDESLANPINFANKPTMWKVLDSDAIDTINSQLWLNPAGSETPELIARSFVRSSGSSTTSTLDIDVPDEDNLCAVVYTGSYTNVNNSGTTFGGAPMTSVEAANGSYGGQDYDANVRILTGLTSGSNTVTTTFASSTRDRFLYVLIFKNVAQSSTVSTSETDSGSSGIAMLAGPVTYADIFATANNQLGLLCTLGDNSTHTAGTNQTILVQSKLDDNPNSFTESISSLEFNTGTANVLSAENHTLEDGFLFDDDVLPKSIIKDFNFVYFATSGALFRIDLENIDSWTNNIETVGSFTNKNDTYKPVIKQNVSLFFGDGNVIAQVDRTGTFTPVTNFNLPKNEIVTALAPFDVDVLVGTKVSNYGRVLRWDGLSESWSAEDDIYEKEGVLAFILDDNYVYPVIGQKGSIYYYNGAKCEDFITIPEVTGQNKIKVNTNAVGYYLGSPIMGISNVSGNPVLQGVYGYGSYNSNYARSLSLDYPIPTDEFADVEIGSILVDGEDLYISYTDGSDTGVAKLDWTAKYANAYMETICLTPANIRHQIKSITDVMVPYFSLPSSTGITIAVNKDYTTFGSNLTVQDDTLRKLVKLKSPHIPNTVNPRLKIGFTVNSNNAPVIEDVLFGIAPVGKK